MSFCPLHIRTCGCMLQHKLIAMSQKKAIRARADQHTCASKALVTRFLIAVLLTDLLPDLRDAASAPWAATTAVGPCALARRLPAACASALGGRDII